MLETISEKFVTARKPHKCNFCGCEIKKGQMYHSETIKYDDSIYTWKSHTECHRAARELNMDDYCDEGITADNFRNCVNDFIGDNAPELLEQNLYERVKGCLDILKNEQVTN